MTLGDWLVKDHEGFPHIMLDDGVWICLSCPDRETGFESKHAVAVHFANMHDKQHRTIYHNYKAYFHDTTVEGYLRMVAEGKVSELENDLYWRNKDIRRLERQLQECKNSKPKEPKWDYEVEVEGYKGKCTTGYLKLLLQCQSMAPDAIVVKYTRLR